MGTPNWKNRTIWTRDNLQVLRGLNSDTVDLIYLDPPFNSNRTYSAPIGSKAAGATFKDAWTFDDADRLYLALLKHRNPVTFSIIDAARLAHGRGMAAYLGMMTERLVEMRRILKPTGSIYLHCDPTASHYLKMLMDTVFGHGSFRNEIAWCYRGMTPKSRKFNAKHDILLFYTASDEYTFHELKGEPTEGSLSTYRSAMKRGYNANHARGMVVIFDEQKYRQAVAYGKIPADMRESHFDGGAPRLTDWWADIKVLGGPKNKERTGYPTQKPLALVDRIIQASSNKGDVILDPFCGCATACVSAERLQRQWVGIDISAKAAELVQSRLQNILDEIPLYKDGVVIHRKDQPGRTDMGKLPRPQSYRSHLWGEQNGFCGGCGEWFLKRNMTIDHIVPRAHGGGDHLENLWLLCNACNSAKGTKSQEQFLKERMKRHVADFPWLVE